MYYIKNPKIAYFNRGNVKGIGWVEKAAAIRCRPNFSKNFSHEFLGIRYVLRKKLEGLEK